MVLKFVAVVFVMVDLLFLVMLDKEHFEFVVVVDLHHVLTKKYHLYLIQILLQNKNLKENELMH